LKVISLLQAFPSAIFHIYYYYYYNNNHFTALWTLSGTTRVSRCQKKHSPTHNYHSHQSSLICFLHLSDPWHNPCSIYEPDSISPLSKFSLVYFLAWHPPLHTPYISSSSHCLRFAAHAYTIATCFAVIQKLYHLILVSLSTFYLELYLVA